MLARGNRDTFLQTRARWEAAGEDVGRTGSGTRTLPSRGRRARLRRSDSRDSLDDGRPSNDSPPPPPSRDSASKSKLKSEKRRKSSATGEERTSVVPLLPFSDSVETLERKSSTAGEERQSVVPLLPFSDGIELSDVGTPGRTESPRRISKSSRRSSAITVTLETSNKLSDADLLDRRSTDSPGRRSTVEIPDWRSTSERQREEPEKREEESGKRRLGRTPSLGARDRPFLWSTDRESTDKSAAPATDGDDGEDGYRPSQRAALGIGADWGGSLNRRRMPRTETPSGTVGKASGFQLPAVISGRLARQSESFVSSSPDLSRDLFSPTGARSPRVGRRDLDEILERAARRRSRQAAGGTPLLTARSLFAAEPRAGRAGRAESEDRWERGSEDRPEVPDSPGGRPWRRVRQDSDTSDASSAAGRSSSSGVPDGEQRAERPPASPLVAGFVPTPRRSGFRGRAGSEGGILDAPDEYSTAVGGWRGTSRSWLTLGSRSAEAAADDAAETSSVSSSSTDRKSSTRHWLAQGRLDGDDASETASIGTGGGGDRRRGASRGSGWTEPAEEATSPADPPPATPPPKQRHDSPAHSLMIVNVQKASTPTIEPLVNGFSVSDYKAESKADDGDVFSSEDRSTLLRKKLAALRAGAQSERELEKSGDEMDSENRASQLRQKVAALTPEVETQPRDTDVPNEDSGENRAMLLRKKIAAMKKPKSEVEPEGAILDDAAEENRATALRQKLAGLRPGSLALPVTADADSRGAEVGPLRSPLTPRSPRPDRPSEVEPGAEEASRSRPTGRSKLAVLTKPTTPADGSGRPPTDRSPATPRGPRPRSAVRRTSSLSGRDSSVGRSRSRSPVKGRIATLRLKPRRVSQSPDPMARWRSVDDVLGSPAVPVHPGGDDRSWEPQTAAVEPPSPPPSQDEPLESGQSPADGSPPLPPARPPRRRKSRPGEPGSPVKERVDENRNQICTTESSESREESSSSPPSSPSPGRPSTETEAVSAGEAWLASLTPAGRGRSWSASSCGSLGSFDLERELLSAEESASGVPRQLTSVKSDLIAFSPKKEDEQVPTPTPVAAPAAPAPAAAPASAVPADLSASQPPTPTDGNVAELLKKQELYFQDQLLKRDREMTAMKNANAKLIQQASSNKTEKVLERVAHLVASLTNENGRLRHELNTDRARLVAERDEARQEVANAEAMFADLHRKYEKSKAVLQEHRRCADQNQAAFRDAKERAEREKQRFDMLRQHSEDAHARLEADYEAAEKAHQTELLTLKAKLQLAENREAKLERENREITAICDELIQKMGAGAAR